MFVLQENQKIKNLFSINFPFHKLKTFSVRNSHEIFFACVNNTTLLVYTSFCYKVSAKNVTTGKYQFEKRRKFKNLDINIKRQTVMYYVNTLISCTCSLKANILTFVVSI